MDTINQLLATFLPADLAEKQEIALALIVVVITVLFLIVSKLVKPLIGTGGKTFVISGPCNGGKTCLFNQLQGTALSEGTVASMLENEGYCQVPNAGSARIIDVPGHERLRHKLDQHLKDARAVIFVLDAVDITPHKAEAAEELFEILTHPSTSRRRVPVLVACNKMDLDAQAHSLDFIRRTLEKQLDAMRKTRTTLSAETKAKAAVLGKADGKPLTLASLRNSITVVPISALKGDIAEVHAFMCKAMR